MDAYNQLNSHTKQKKQKPAPPRTPRPQADPLDARPQLVDDEVEDVLPQVLLRVLGMGKLDVGKHDRLQRVPDPAQADVEQRIDQGRERMSGAMLGTSGGTRKEVALPWQTKEPNWTACHRR